MLDSSANLKFINNNPVASDGVLTRASVATYKDENGWLRTAAANVARPWFTDAGWRGLLIEGAATQILTAGGWSGGLAAGAVTGAPSPDGLNNGTTLTATTTATAALQKAGVSGNGTFSIFVAPQDAFNVQLTINNGTTWQTFNLQTMTPPEGGRIEQFALGFYRLSISGNASNVGIRFSGATAGQQMIIFGENLTNGALSSAIIGASSRAADVYLGASTTNRLAYSSVPAIDTSNPDESTAVLWVSGTYNQGDRVVYRDIIYQCSASPSTTDRPDIGEQKDPKTWVIVSSTNRWKMFDMNSGIDSPTTRPDYIETIISVGSSADMIAIHGLSGGDLNIQVIADGAVTEYEIPIISNYGIDTFWDWFYKDRVSITQTTQEIMAPPGSLVRILATGDSGSIQIGKVVIGDIETVGITLESLPIENSDFSTVERNAWGVAIIRPGRIVDVKKYSCVIDSQRTAYLNELFKKLGRTPTSWIGLDGVDATILFGFKESAYFDYRYAQKDSFADITVIGL